MTDENNDQLDENILHLIETDARLTYTEIAQKLSSTESQVKSRIEELIKLKIIRKYTTIIDWEKFGKESYTAWVEIDLHPQAELGYDEIARKIGNHSSVQSIHLVSGTYDLVLVVKADKMRDITQLIADILAPFPDVRDTNTHFILRIYKENGEMMYEDRELLRGPFSP